MMDNEKLADYLRDVVKQVPGVVPLLSDEAQALVGIKYIKADGSMSSIRSQYNSAIVEILTGYFEGGGSVSAPRNAFNRTANDALGAAFDLGWVDGGQEMPPDGDALDWFNARIQQEFGNIASLFEQAKQLRKEPDFDYFAWITARADGYTASLDGVHNAAKMLAKKNQLLTWHLGATEQHCTTCAGLDGYRAMASYYINNNYIPRTPGANLKCGGYNCDCRLTDSEGNEVTI